MIAELTFGNRGVIERNPSRDASFLKIRALFRAYGLGRSFIKFFCDEKGNILICVQDNVATLYVKDNSFTYLAGEFLSLIVNEVATQAELELEGFSCESGNVYSLDKWDNVLLEDVREDIQSGYNVLSKVFTDSINSTTYNRWYTDLSHRIRHDMSKIYTVEGVCTATAGVFDNGTILISQLATLQEKRGQGYAKNLLFHIATSTKGTKEILLLSQNQLSDAFYEKIGFIKKGKWHLYKR